MGIDLSIIWFVIIVFATLMYIVMDGFDLGIGILFPTTQDADDRDVMVNSVAPVWDGNETWLVLGGAALFGAFPLAYAVIIDALTIPLTLMLIGLIFRGVAFEFRFKATPTHRPFWDKAFIGGSILATFSQGVVVGAVINGFAVTNRTYSGGPFDWFTLFNLFCGVGLTVAYALLGATWLVMKSEDPLQAKMRKVSKQLLIVLLLVIAAISLWTPLAHPTIAERWFSLPNLFFLLPVPLLVVVLTGWAWKKLGDTESHNAPFVLTLGLIFLGFSGLGISIWPYIIPPSITLWQAAAPPQSQGFMLVGALLIIPIILVYTFWSYYVFRGKVQHGEGYH
ncbi:MULTISPECIES: cytochrome d ubiquinol oxidase subunit II [Lelliottia]|jgi:cytochrome d ubiquinol oxidase subunit II|uniref:Cytochrome d ubiquinol oxidase subunit II n=1 Tax=Lelliottia aquatilis TaxID=2080838 RepID=A0ABX5A731_9ENTR|nr:MULTISPECIES: cytochrome d ubiquinol oxidase subunit II [Lelliottia]POZ19223.1 cytochrome d ubiquinol oxidase subunit II [Lelliottia aquatilis]POZ27142.1 cytochrome d ubiquinol oxidase subunit II [Lelliottia aquatilis]POZ33895.1 cytochrome d ubiquinol oxidase subunit II [Lelliottia aquatilis]POZ34429.1 cytochrome d ubiquinol oxidase subunit II [Lelliottia sp. 7254-16]POZ34963.1 cytochrome d ubiquinol oxidase subunit II [Lelliottia aquatilis]